MSKKKSVRSGTPATTALDRAGLPYSLHTYDHDDTAIHFGEEAAAKLGVDPGTIFKTLIVDSGSGPGQHRLAVAVVPVSGQLDMKAMASVLGVKRVDLADPPVAARSSGYVVGGISPIGQRTALPTVIDDSAADQKQIMVSAGRRGLQVQLSPSALAQLTSARFAPIDKSR